VTRSSEKMSTVNIQQRLLTFVTRSNWVLLVSVSLLGLLATSPPFARGLIFGGLIVTINFHLLAKTLKKALRPQQLTSPNVILVKYYIRFIISGVIIFFLIRQQVVNPIGLFIGLSVVVASITLATMVELKKLIFKEAV
jgi:ATP synthase I subunit